jgi:hypothetical protein
VDLSTIEQWTREMLEGEAKRRGIRNPEFRTHGELVRLILKHQYGDRLAAGRERFARSKRTFDEARSLLGTAVGATLSSIPGPLGALLRARGPQLPVAEPEAARTHMVPDSERPQREERGAAAATDSEPVADSDSETVAESRTDSDSASITDSHAVTEAVTVSDADAASDAASDADAHTAVEAAPAVDAIPDTDMDDEPVTAVGGAAPLPTPAWPEPPPPAREARTQKFEQEPIRTRSMAQLLASQGHRERALAIYEELCAQNSEDGELRTEAERLRVGELPDAPALPRPSEHPHALPQRDDRIECSAGPGEGLRLRWAVTEDGRRRARAVLGDDGELAVRLVTIRPDPERVVRSEITEHGPVHPSGEWMADAVAGQVRAFATIGLRQGERFVSIAHARAGE